MSEVSLKTQKKITFVLGGLVGGGAEKVASSLIKKWHSNGYEITLVTRLGPEKDFFTVPPEVTRIILGGEGESSNKIIALFKNIPFIWKLRRAIKKTGNPIVISFLTKTNIHMLLATRGLGVHTIISERSDTTRQNHPRPWPKLRKWLYKYADVVTANSYIALEGMKEYVPESNLQYIPNPVDIPIEKASPHASSLILSVGRLVPLKAQYLLIEAFSKLNENNTKEWICKLLGEGEEKENLQKMAQQLKISDRVEFPGLVMNTSDYYRKAGIFVLTSEYEGTPNSLLEAMTHGLPAIVSDSLPGALEFIRDGENGLVFKAGDSDDLCLKLTRLIENPDLRKKMGQQAVKSVEHLTIVNVIKEWEELIHS